MKKLFIYYGFIVASLMTLVSFMSASSYPQLISSSLFFPIAVFFALLVLPSKKRSLIAPERRLAVPSKKKAVKKQKTAEKPKEVETLKKEGYGLDKDRRAFLKLIGTAGLSIFMFSVFGVKKAQAAFFGSVPGPGVVSLKDIAGNKIDPSEKHPTDGYRLAELDDSAPAYYGFTDKDAAWYIMKENTDGSYRYARGSSAFSTNWTNRADPGEVTYSRYEDIF